jgi:hypothetical protein
LNRLSISISESVRFFNSIPSISFSFFEKARSLRARH